MSKILVGKTILSMMIAQDRKAILFNTDSGLIVAKCYGDCCSDTWVEHVELFPGGFPAKVVDVVDLDMPDLGAMEGRDVVAYYGCKISTDKGDIILDYRNDSNGYYGGSLSWPDDSYFYGGVYGQNVSNEEWREIKEA